MKLTGRGKQTFFCPSCNTTKPQKGRKHVHGRAVCSECVGKAEGHSNTSGALATRMR